MTKCLNCGNTNLTLWSESLDQEYGTRPDTKTTYFCCTTCETISIDYTLEEILSEIYPKNYYSYTGKNYGLMYKIKFWIDRKFYDANLPEYDEGTLLKILDIGGGTGEALLNLERKFNTCIIEGTVVDLDSNAKFGAEQKGYKFIEQSIYSVNLANDSFDIILAFNILEHMEDPNKFLSICTNMLRKNGKLIIQTPNFKSLDAWLFRWRYWGGLHTPRHFCIYSTKSLKEALRGHNLKIKKSVRALAGPFWAFSVLASFNHTKLNRKLPLFRYNLFPVLVAFFSMFDFLRRPFFETSQQLVIVEKANYVSE